MTRYIPIAAAAVALLATGAIAQDAKVLTGKDAFGNWEQDAPGIIRHIRAEDLDPPNVTQSASNGPENVARPQGAMPKVKDGFKIELVLEGLNQPRTLRFAPNGDLFVALSDAGEVRVYQFEEGNPEPIEEGVYAEGLNQPYGIAFYPPGDNPQWIYIAESDGLKRYPYKAGDMKAPEDRDAAETILEGIPAEHHWTRDLAFSADGSMMHYSIGSGSNVGLDMTMEKAPDGSLEDWINNHPLGVSWGGEERRATVMSYDSEGKNEQYFATGLRNCSGMTIQPATGALWCVVNERDELGDNIPFDYATSVQEGHFYGWPWYYIGGNPDPRWADQPREDLKDKVTVPDVLFQSHSAPLNIAFYESDAWGEEYKGDAFVTMHGSWNRDTRTGYKVVRLNFDENGEPDGTYEDFVTGFVLSDTDVWGRPVGIAVAPDGSLFFSEDGSGTIWRVSTAD